MTEWINDSYENLDFCLQAKKEKKKGLVFCYTSLTTDKWSKNFTKKHAKDFFIWFTNNWLRKTLSIIRYNHVKENIYILTTTYQWRTWRLNWWGELMLSFAAFSRRFLSELFCFKMTNSQWYSFLYVVVWECVGVSVTTLPVIHYTNRVFWGLGRFHSLSIYSLIIIRLLQIFPFFLNVK